MKLKLVSVIASRADLIRPGILQPIGK